MLFSAHVYYDALQTAMNILTHPPQSGRFEAKYLTGGQENLRHSSAGSPSALHWWWIAINIGRTKKRQAGVSN
jgi:hypothetical protein